MSTFWSPCYKELKLFWQQSEFYPELVCFFTVYIMDKHIQININDRNNNK